MTADLLEQAGIDHEWAHAFVVESNQIDPQPGENAPGSPIYDLHMQALLYAIRAGLDDCYALPRELHKMLLSDHPSAGVFRTQPIVIGFRATLNPRRVPYYTWRWNADARERIGALRTREEATSEERHDEVWGLHCELMNVRPFELYNGRVGRLLMVNHAILVGEDPWIVPASERADYLDTIHAHPSATWVDEPLYRPSAVSYREW
jgi:hypothetical protein